MREIALQMAVSGEPLSEDFASRLCPVGTVRSREAVEALLVLRQECGISAGVGCRQKRGLLLPYSTARVTGSIPEISQSFPRCWKCTA